MTSVFYLYPDLMLLYNINTPHLVGQFLIVQFGGAVFRTEPLDWQTWLLIIGVSSMVLWVGELVRLVQRIIHKRKRNEK